MQTAAQPTWPQSFIAQSFYQVLFSEISTSHCSTTCNRLSYLAMDKDMLAINSDCAVYASVATAQASNMTVEDQPQHAKA